MADLKMKFKIWLLLETIKLSLSLEFALLRFHSFYQIMNAHGIKTLLYFIYVTCLKYRELYSCDI